LRKSRILNVTDVWKSAGAIAKRFFGKSILHNVASFKTQSSAKSLGAALLPWETFFMRSKLAISALVVTSLFGSTLIASAQNQPAPGASNEEISVPALPPARKRERVRPQGRPRAFALTEQRIAKR
jgi:hypothetical protein